MSPTLPLLNDSRGYRSALFCNARHTFLRDGYCHKPGYAPLWTQCTHTHTAWMIHTYPESLAIFTKLNTSMHAGGSLAHFSSILRLSSTRFGPHWVRIAPFSPALSFAPLSTPGTVSISSPDKIILCYATERQCSSSPQACPQPALCRYHWP